MQADTCYASVVNQFEI